MSRAEIIETMARAICKAAGHHHWSDLPADDAAAHHSGRNGGTWDCQSDYLEQAAAALTALEAAGMAVVEWRPIDTADLELCARAPCLVTAEGAVGEARYFPDQKGWWWADYHPTDYLDRQCFPSHWMPLPAPPAHTQEKDA